MSNPNSPNDPTSQGQTPWEQPSSGDSAPGNPQGNPQSGGSPQGYPDGSYQSAGYPAQQGYSGQPAYGSQPGYGGYPAVAEDPGKTLGIVGLVLAFFTTIVGLVISIIAFRKSKKAGFKNTPALVGIIVGAVTSVLAIVSIIAVVGLSAGLVQQVQQACAGQPSGARVQVSGTTVTCP